METARDGRTWRIGTAAEVAWIASDTAIPAVFEAYATVHPLEDERIDVEECARVHHLGARSGDQPWWLGFLDTGAHDVLRRTTTSRRPARPRTTAQTAASDVSRPSASRCPSRPGRDLSECLDHESQVEQYDHGSTTQPGCSRPSRAAALSGRYAVSRWWSRRLCVVGRGTCVHCPYRCPGDV